MASTHYEKATGALEAFSGSVDSEHRSREYEAQLLQIALVQAVLDASTQLAKIRQALDPLVSVRGDG